MSSETQKQEQYLDALALLLQVNLPLVGLGLRRLDKRVDQFNLLRQVPERTRDMVSAARSSTMNESEAFGWMVLLGRQQYLALSCSSSDA